MAESRAAAEPADTEAAVREVRSLLEPCADPLRAPAMAAYMKQVCPFLGMSAPQRRAATRAWIASCPADGDQLLAIARSLAACPEREYAYVGIDLLTRHRRRLGPEALPRLRELALTRPWWDTVDAMSSLIGSLGLIHAGWDEEVLRWAHDEHLWARRVALVFQVGRKADTNLDLLFAACDANVLGSRFGSDFFMRKGIGWGLRDAGRTYPQDVWWYVRANGDRLSPLSVREATRRLPEMR